MTQFLIRAHFFLPPLDGQSAACDGSSPSSSTTPRPQRAERTSPARRPRGLRPAGAYIDCHAARVAPGNIIIFGRVILLSYILKSRIHFTVLRIYDSSHKTFNRHRPKSARLLVSAGRAARRVSHALSPRVHFISLQLMAIITNRFMGASLPRRRAAATIVFADRQVVS